MLDDDGALVGILSKSDFLKEIPRQLILVDHNELAQAVRGADKVPIVEILDHHKLGGFASDTPILFWNNPVGSTSTIVALCYQQLGIPIDAAHRRPAHGRHHLRHAQPHLAHRHAGRLHGARSPRQNRRRRSRPARRANLQRRLAAAHHDAEQAIGADSKPYEENGHRFIVAQIEELTFAHFPEKRDALLDALAAQRDREGLLFAALLVTDINEQTSLLLVQGDDSFLQTIDYPQRSPHIWELAGVVSRKKQLLPYLLNRIETWSARAGS